MKCIYKYLLNYHAGSPSRPVVRKGDRVKRGQMIAEKPDEFLGIPIYSGVNGEIQKVTTNAIYICADERQGQEYQTLKADSAEGFLSTSGILLGSGRGFPVYAKLRKPFGKNSGMIIVNMDDPGLENIEHDQKFYADMKEGLRIVMDMVRAKSGVFVTGQTDKQKSLLGSEAIGSDPSVRVFNIGDRCTVSESEGIDEKLRSVLRADSGLPQKADMIVLDGGTLWRIYEAVVLKKPYMDLGVCEGFLN